jgi:putative sterol carrier protein
MTKAQEIDASPSKQEMVRRWVRGYAGRVIGFKTPDESYYLAFAHDHVALGEGDYPGCEFSYRGSQDTILAVIEKEVGARSGVRSGKLKVWGSLGEAQRFEGIL